MNIISIINWTVNAVLLCGFTAAVCYAVKKPQQRAQSIACSVLFAVYFIYVIVRLALKFETATPICLLQCAGLLVFICSVIHAIQYKNCTHEINATYLSSDCIRVKASSTYTPKFFYIYNNKEYRQASFIGYHARTHNKLYSEHNSYTIFIDPKKPYNCVDKRVIPLHAIIEPLIAGIVLFVMFFGTTLYLDFNIR